MSNNRRLILITGIPGTGKTFMGNYFQEHLGFLHIDMEEKPQRFSRSTNKFLASTDEDLVVTWGFSPVDLSAVQRVQRLGFFTTWFDGNRDAALRSFNRRGTVEERMFHIKLNNIEVCQIVSHLQHVQVNTFDEDGEFRSQKDIADEILHEYEMDREPLI